MKQKRGYFFVAAFSCVAAFVLSLLVFVILLETSVHAQTVDKKKTDSLTVLVAGVDESGNNTDVLLLLSVSKKDGNMNLLQIPRDTFLKYGNAQGKINGYFRRYTDKYGNKCGAEKFTEVISDALGVPIDAYAVFSAQTVESIVDTMGGVSFDVPYSFSYESKRSGKTEYIEAGVHHLNGEEAAAFIKHRSSYLEGDLGRLDAQMRFMAAFIKRLQSLHSFKQYKEIYQKNRANLLTNLTEKDIINIIMVYLKNHANVKTQFMRLPGEACRGNSGAWFYVLNRSACAEMLSVYYSVPSNSFDRATRFVLPSREAFSKIYYAAAYPYRVYSLKDAENVTVLGK